MIDRFDIPPYFIEAVNNPAACEVLKFTPEIGDGIRSIFLSVLINASSEISFQAFDRRRLLSGQNRISIINQAGTFKRLEEPGLILDHQLAAYYSNGKLFFRSYGTVKRIFDLTAYYHEATEPEIEAFLDTERLYCADHERFRDSVDSWTRKKIALIRDAGLLGRIAPRKIKSAAGQFGLTVDLKKVSGKEAIVLPTKKKALKELLRFLDEDHFKAPLTGTHFISNSKMKA